MYPFKSDCPHQPHDALEARAYVQRMRTELRLRFGVHKDKRPRHTGIHLFYDEASSAEEVFHAIGAIQRLTVLFGFGPPGLRLWELWWQGLHEDNG